MGHSDKFSIKEFPRTFWIANVMELFERGAYYGMNAVLAVYLTNKIGTGGLGFTEESVGFLQAIVYSITYIIPILGGALAEKLGYRKMLIAAFSLLTFGYFASGFVTTYGIIFATLCTMAVGSGLFKPIISGTIARTTTEKNSGFGFGIYYWMINLGAFIAPLIAGYLKGFSWRYVFMASALWCFLMLIPSIFLYKDPELPGKSKTMKETAADAAMVLGDSRFMLMVFIYSFFWILYFQNFGTILWYLRDFINPETVNIGMSSFLNNTVGWFFGLFGASLNFNFVLGPEHVTVVNAGTIILLQVFISRIVKNIKALPVMCTGIIVGSLGFLILALTSNAWLFILGIAVFSIGEMTAHPKYYSYIGLVAPQDKKAIYLGYAFLYGVIGSLFGSNFGALAYTAVVKPRPGHPGNPTAFFLGLFVLGIIAFLGLLLFNRFFAEDTDENQHKARKYVAAVYSLLIFSGIAIMLWKSTGDKLNYKALAQSVILALIGVGGLIVTYKSRNNNRNA